MTPIRNINDPDFFEEENLRAYEEGGIGEDARLADFGPGPNEAQEYVQAKSIHYQRAIAEGERPMPAYTPPAYMTPAPQAAPVSDARLDRLEAMVERLITAQLPGGNNG